HQPIPRGAAAVFWRRRTPARQAHRRVIAVTARLRVEQPHLPFPKIDASAGIEKCLSRAQLKLPQRGALHLRPAEKTGEFLAVDANAEADSIPAEKGAKNFVEVCQSQVIRECQDPDYHGAHFAQYCS